MNDVDGNPIPKTKPPRYQLDLMCPRCELGFTHTQVGVSNPHLYCRSCSTVELKVVAMIQTAALEELQ